MAYHIFISELFSLSLPSYLLLALFISMQRAENPFLGTSSIKSETPLTLPSYFICAPVLASRLPPFGTANNIRLKDGY